MGDKRRAEILELTGKVVRERGFANTRLSDVAAAVGVSAPLIVYHFGSKDALFAATLDHAVRAELDRMDEIATSAETASAKLDRLLVMSFGAGAREEWAMWIDSWGEALRSDPLWDMSDELDTRWHRCFRNVIAQGVRDGEFEVDGVDATASRIGALVDGLGVRCALERNDKASRDLLTFARVAVGREVGATIGPPKRRRPTKAPAPAPASRPAARRGSGGRRG